MRSSEKWRTQLNEIYNFKKEIMKREYKGESMKEKEICENAFKVRLYEYTSEKCFDKLYKLLVTDENNNELFMATGIKHIDCNFNYTIRNYEWEIAQLNTEIKVYKEIINDFQEKIEIKMKGEEK